MDLTYITTYAPQEMHRGGAAWVDQRIVSSLDRKFDVNMILVEKPDPEHSPLPLNVRQSRLHTAVVLGRMLAYREPYQVAKYRWHPAWKRLVGAIREASVRQDLIVTSQWPALLACHEAGVRPDLHIAHNVDYVLSVLYDPSLFRLLHNAAKVEKVEVAILQQAKQIVALSRADVSRLAGCGFDVKHLALYTKLTRRPAVRAASRSTVVGYLANLSWPPNKQDLKLLELTILPAINEHMNEKVQLSVGGRGSKEIPEPPNCHHKGIIGELDQWYQDIDVSILPRDEKSSGVSVKLLESIERGVPVLAPSAAYRAIGLKSEFETQEVGDYLAQLHSLREKSSNPVGEPDGGPSMRPGDLGDLVVTSVRGHE